jgi:hypothetical protein
MCQIRHLSTFFLALMMFVQGAYIGASLDGCVLRVRDAVNAAFYGLPVSAADLLLPVFDAAPPVTAGAGCAAQVAARVPPPPAAAALYDALHALVRK